MSDTVGWIIAAAAWVLWIASYEPPMPRWLTSTLGPVFDGITTGATTLWETIVAVLRWRP